MSLNSIPKTDRQLRACLICSMVKSLDQFDRDGCDNCERFLKYRGNRDLVVECTSASFEGLIGMMTPEQSWVSKWQRINHFVPGMYAISVNGRLPPSIVRELKAQGLHYRSRDTSQRMRE